MFIVLPLRDTAPRPELPIVTWLLIALNVAVFFIVQLPGPGGPVGVIALFGLEPARLWAGELLPGTLLPAWITLLTSAFLHFDFMHLASNMLMLWIFGDALEWLCGWPKFVVFYLLCAVLSAVATAALGAGSAEAAAGASGAIAGVMGGYLLTYPRARVTCWIFWWFLLSVFSGVRNISALWFIGLWVAQQLVYSVLAANLLEPGPFGVHAHAMGALAGMGLVYLLREPSRTPRPGEHWGHPRLSLPLIGDEGDAGGGGPVRLPAHEQARIDRLRAMYTPFDDRPVRVLLAQGDVVGARAYCELMLAQAEDQFNDARAAGYRQLLAEIDQLQRPG